MHDVIAAALQAATEAGAEYADARVVEARHESIDVANGRLDALEQSESVGVGVRVLVNGSWGFASVNEPTSDAAARVAAEAVAIGRASSRVQTRPVELSPLEPQRGSWSGPCEIDPFSVPLGDKISLLMSTDELLRANDKVAVTETQYGAHAFRTWFGSTEGSRLEQQWTEVGAGASAITIGEGEVLTRSYPNSHGGSLATGRLGVRPGSGPARQRGANRGRGGGVAVRRDLPQRALRPHHRREPARASGARIGRPPHGAGPRPRRGSRLRGHVVGRPRRPRDAPVRLGPHDGECGLDGLPVRSAPSGGTTRGCPRSATSSSRRASWSASSPRARPRLRSGVRATVRCAPTGGTASRWYG